MSSAGTIVVTGGAGAIGGAIAELLVARTTHDVLLLDREQPVRLVDGSRVRGAALDVADDQAWDELARDLGDTTVRGLVTAAGILQAGTIDEVSVSQWDTMVDVNLKGTYLAARALLPHLRRAGGAVVTISSISGRTRSTFAAPSYVASKAGVIGLTMSLAAQEAPGVRVNAVAPGVIESPMTASYGPERLAALRAAIPLDRLGSPEDVAAAVVWLLSDDSAYVTGQTINVNGGQFML